MDVDSLKITGFYRGLKTLTIEKETINSFDPEGKMFLNINTRKDFEHISSL
jgi:hypothetical protein